MEVARASNLVNDADVIPSTAMREYCDWNDANSNFGDNCLSVLSINSHSLLKISRSIHAYRSLTASRFTFIVVVETWLADFRDKALEIQGYKSHAIHRLNQTSAGGIKLYYRDHVTINVIDQFTGIFDSCESISAKANIRGFGMYDKYICVYRPPCKLPTHFEN